MNIRSANRNLDEFLLILKKLQLHFSVVVLTETWLNATYDWTEVPGYRAYHAIREGRSGGGVTILVRSHLSAEYLPALTLVGDCRESLGVDVTFGGVALTILGTYRPPSSSLALFNQEYFDFIAGVAQIEFTQW